MDKDFEEKAIEYLFFNKPKRLFEIIEKMGKDINEIIPVDLGKLLIRERYKENKVITDDHFKAAEFVLWASYFVEREVSETIVDVEVIEKKRDRLEVEVEIEKMTFTPKILFIAENYSSEDDPYIKALLEVKDLRNHLAHGRWEQLCYEGYSLSDKRGQILLTNKLMRSAMEKYRKEDQKQGDKIQ